MGGRHQKNIIWWFQPFHSPDDNLIELGVWLKNKLAWKLFDNLDQLKPCVADIFIPTSTAFLASVISKTLLSTRLDYLGSRYIQGLIQLIISITFLPISHESRQFLEHHVTKPLKYLLLSSHPEHKPDNRLVRLVEKILTILTVR